MDKKGHNISKEKKKGQNKCNQDRNELGKNMIVQNKVFR